MLIVMITKRIVYSIFLLHILLCFSWWILHICLPDGLRLNVVLDSILYYGMLCTLPIWFYPIGRVIRKSLNHNKLLGVLVIILSSVVVLVGGFIALLVFIFSGQSLYGIKIRLMSLQKVLHYLNILSSCVIGEE